MIKKYIIYGYRLFWWSINLWRFKKLGMYSYINRALKIDGAKNISIGRKVTIQYKTWLASRPLTANNSPILEIGDGSAIGNFNHIYSTNKIIIGKKVLTADKVYISDNIHGFLNPLVPIMNQPIIQKNAVIIGDGTWLGENVCVIGAKIGKNCVIGANSVVTKDIPDFCIAVGAPARVIKRYNFETQEWEKTNKK
ncbi:MAG TPA: acyltransferase [Bacteroidales bacterium]|nr:acyltransferase [Bacteroidales bacterium]